MSNKLKDEENHSKSYDWFLHHVETKKEFLDNDFIKESLYELSSSVLFNEIFKTSVTERLITLTGKLNGESIVLNYILHIDPSLEDYDYYFFKSCIHDGTLLFEKELVDSVCSDILNLRCIKNSKNFVFYLNHIVHVTIGNIILNNKYQEEFTEEKGQWMTSKSQVFVPIKIRYEYVGDY